MDSKIGEDTIKMLAMELDTQSRRFDDHTRAAQAYDDLRDTEIKTIKESLVRLEARADKMVNLLTAWESAQGFVKVIEWMAKVTKATATMIIYLSVATGFVVSLVLAIEHFIKNGMFSGK